MSSPNRANATSANNGSGVNSVPFDTGDGSLDDGDMDVLLELKDIADPAQHADHSHAHAVATVPTISGGDIPRCGNCLRTQVQLPAHTRLKRCLQCQSVWYCCIECQRAHWPKHKEECRRIALSLESIAQQKKLQQEELLRRDHRSGRLYLFGAGMFGVMGTGDPKETNLCVPTPVTSLDAARVARVALGSSHALCVTSDGQLYSWGLNENGQLGQGDRQTRYSPQPVVALDTKTISHISAGFAHSAVVSNSGEAITFGAGELGQLGVNISARKLAALPLGVSRWDLDDHVSPKIVKELNALNVSIIQVACGEAHTLCLSDIGQVYAFGDSSRGATGVSMEGGFVGPTTPKSAALKTGGGLRKSIPSPFSTETNVLVPTLVDALAALPVVDIAAGAHHSLAVTATGSLYSWGAGKHGATGHGRDEISFVPQRLKIIVQIPASEDHGGETQPSSVYVRSCSAGGYSSAAVTIQGQLYTWGDNSRGQLGVNSREDYFVPTRVNLPSNVSGNKSSPDASEQMVTKVAVGARHMACVTSDQTVYTWGSGDVGQLGHGNWEDAWVPKRLQFSVISADGLPSAPVLGANANGVPVTLATPVSFPHPDLRVLDISCGSDITALVVVHVPQILALSMAIDSATELEATKSQPTVASNTEVKSSTHMDTGDRTSPLIFNRTLTPSGESRETKRSRGTPPVMSPPLATVAPMNIVPNSPPVDIPQNTTGIATDSSFPSTPEAAFSFSAVPTAFVGSQTGVTSHSSLPSPTTTRFALPTTNFGPVPHSYGVSYSPSEIAIGSLGVSSSSASSVPRPSNAPQNRTAQSAELKLPASVLRSLGVNRAPYGDPSDSMPSESTHGHHLSPPSTPSSGAQELSPRPTTPTSFGLDSRTHDAHSTHRTSDHVSAHTQMIASDSVSEAFALPVPLPLPLPAGTSSEAIDAMSPALNSITPPAGGRTLAPSPTTYAIVLTSTAGSADPLAPVPSVSLPPPLDVAPMEVERATTENTAQPMNVEPDAPLATEAMVQEESATISTAQPPAQIPLVQLVPHASRSQTPDLSTVLGPPPDTTTSTVPKFLPRILPPSAFQYSTFLSKLRTARLSEDYKPLAVYIYQVISHPSALNASFLPPTSAFHFRVPNASDLRIYRSGIDAIMVERFYKMALSLKRNEVTKALTTAIQKSLAEMVGFFSRPRTAKNDEGSFRALAIILQCPLLGRTGLSERALLHDLCTAIRRLSATAHERLKEWWSVCYPSDIFGARLVGMLNRHLYNQLRAYLGLRDVDDTTVLIVDILRLLHEANAMRGLIPPERFYVKDLIVHVDMAVDYSRWANAFVRNSILEKEGKSTQISVPFTFCRNNFLIDPLTKSRILRFEHLIHQAQQQIVSLSPVCMLRVRRSHLMEDALSQLSRLHPDALKKQLQVEFIGEQGMDAGGLTQELFELVARELMKPEHGLFVYHEDSRTYWYAKSGELPTPANAVSKALADPSTSSNRQLDLFRTAGVIVGTACFHGLSIHVNFPLVLYKKLLAQKTTLEDLIQIDPVMGNGLKTLLEYEGNDVEEVFCLDFTCSTASLFSSEVVTVELIPGGRDIPVTADNKKEYVDLMVEYLLHGSVKAEADAFTSGFLSMCDGLALRHLGFTAHDLELIIAGTPKLDFVALEKSARYEGGYSRDHRVIRWFWDIVQNDLGLEQKQQLLYFCTGSARSPLGGLGEITLTIQRASPDTEMVPTSHVCFHALLIPEYSSREKLKQKLLIAIAHSQGFGLQ